MTTLTLYDDAVPFAAHGTVAELEAIAARLAEIGRAHV